MKLIINVLSAPWPAGAVVGDVIELPAVPAWAVGKCSQTGDDVEATVVAGKIVIGDGAGQALPTLEAINLELADLREKLAAAEQAKDDLQLQLQGTTEAFNETSEARGAAEKDAADLREKLAAAEAAAVDAAANSNTTAKKK